MRARQARYFVLLATLLSAACRRSFTREDALSAIQRADSLLPVLTPDSERVAHETLADCRAMYSDDPVVAKMAGDSAWILLSGAGWMDLADVDAPSDPKQKKHCRAVLTAKADKAAFNEAQDSTSSPWTSYWTVETAHTKAEVVGLPDDAVRNDSAVAEFQLTQEQTPVGELLHRPRWTAAQERLLSTTLTGHFRHYDDGWHLESFDESK